MNEIPERQIRALFNEKTIRVYQAYGDAVAEPALEAGTFVWQGSGVELRPSGPSRSDTSSTGRRA